MLPPLYDKKIDDLRSVIFQLSSINPKGAIKLTAPAQLIISPPFLNDLVIKLSTIGRFIAVD